MVGPLLLLKMIQYRKKSETSTSSLRKEKRKSSIFQKRRSLLYSHNCRVCLNDAGDGIPLFDDDNNDIAQALSTFGGIKVDEEDAYPKYLCQPCHNLLQGAISLRNTAQKSDQMLKKSSKLVAKATKKYRSNRMVKQLNESLNEASSNFVISDDNYLNDNMSDFEEAEVRKSYNCTRCDLDFATLNEFLEHRLSIDHENKQITCTICDKTYSAMYYKKHKVIHEPDCPFMCDICGKKFSTKGSFKKHRLTHFYQLPFKCAHCPYRGRFSESLRMHMRTHTGEKPYQCSECAAQFVNKSNLNKHQKTHRTERDFNCDSCGRGFYTKKTLEMHIKVEHAGIKDQICDICSKAFGTRKQMMKHQLKVHKRQKLRSGRLPLYLQVEKMADDVET